MKRIFISSVQREFERERAAIKAMIANDPFVCAHYSSFVFEIDAPASDKTTQRVYLNEIEKCDVYLLLIGDKYGFEDAEGVSPTEREYDCAVQLGLPVIVFVRGTDNSKREEKERRFLDKVSSGRTRVRYRHTFHGAGRHNHGSAADDVDEIPNSVITEAVNNAIAHRNYANNGSIQVEVYQDRIEVISPGRLMPPLTVESLYGKHESVAPNPHIARALFWVKHIETVGTGLNELLDTCAAAGLKKPTIEANDIHFRLIIWRREVVALPDKLPDKLPDNCPINASTKDRVLAHIRMHPGCSRQQIAESIGLSVESVKLALAALREGLAKIEHRGSNKTGGYYAKEQESACSAGGGR